MSVKYCLLIVNCHKDLSVIVKDNDVISWSLEEGKNKAYEIAKTMLSGRILLSHHKFIEKDDVTYLPFVYFNQGEKFPLPQGYEWKDWYSLGFGEF